MSYTTAFWSWEDWELQLDWMALRGINLALSWVGVEKFYIELFQGIGMTDAEIETFLAGPAFLAWNHFGNIQGSWGGSLPYSWVDSQFEMQLKIIQRMGELGITPILPSFTGFVPRAISRVWPDVSVSNGSTWDGFPIEYTNTTFIDPLDSRFEQLQTTFIGLQKEKYGDVSSFYALDQYNENTPLSGDLAYLQNVSLNTWKSLKAADPNAVWIMQGWPFAANTEFWTNDRIVSFLGGVPVNSDMLILDLFSESQPQWQRTDSYYGKPWIWCQLHDYGHNMGLYGQIMNITVNPIAAMHNSSSMVGMGLSMEGQEGNEIVYDLLLDQAWNETPIDTKSYFENWVTSRYGSNAGSIPAGVYQAWEAVRTTVYNNTNLTANAVPKSILELLPSTTGLTGRTGHHPTVLNYDTSILLSAWKLLYEAALKEPTLFENPTFEWDLVDWTRQILANAFTPLYQDLVATYNDSPDSSERAIKLASSRDDITLLLTQMDSVLATNSHFRLSTWLSAARATVNMSLSNSQEVANFLEYEARNQITLWGPTGQISDYASKSWAGLISGYYLPRWEKFVDYLIATSPAEYNQTNFDTGLLEWELQWVNQTGWSTEDQSVGTLKDALENMVKQLGKILNI